MHIIVFLIMRQINESYTANYDAELDDDTYAKKTEHLTNFVKGIDSEKIFLAGQSKRIKVKLPSSHLPH